MGDLDHGVVQRNGGEARQHVDRHHEVRVQPGSTHCPGYLHVGMTLVTWSL